MSGSTGSEDQSLQFLVNAYGIQMVGVVISSILFGISCLQTFIYYISQPFSRDPLWLKILPAWLMALQAVHLVLLVVAIYKTLVNNFGDYESLPIIPREGYVANIVVGLLAFSAQLFYIWRLWKFGRSRLSIGKYIWVFSSFCVFLATVYLGLTLANASLELAHDDSVSFTSSRTWVDTSYTFASINFFLDAIFVVAMIWLLTHEGRSHYAQTKNMVNRLMILTINSGLATMIAALLFIVFLATNPSSFVYIFFYYLTAPLYCNSVLANLNSREYVRGHPSPPKVSQASRIEFSTPHSLHTLSKPNNSDTETHLDDPESMELDTGFQQHSKPRGSQDV